jgi:radical SAM superfamily enzyme YgiQ (UPF0313 family)
MTPNLLLINPWITDFAAYDLWSKPIGLLGLASLLRQNGVQVRFLDCLDVYHPAMSAAQGIRTPRRKPSGQGSYARQRIPKPSPLATIPRHYHRYGITPAIFSETLRSLERPDAVLMTSMMTYWYPAVYDTIAAVRQVHPGIPVVLGGNYVTLCPDHAAHSGADLCLPGPAEWSISRLLRTLFNFDLSFLPDPLDLDAFPYPAHDLLRRTDQIPLLTSRGCPYRCSYCASHLVSGPFRRRDPLRVVDEIAYWHRHLGARFFSFYDDALLAQPETLAIPLLRELIRRGLDVEFHCPNGLHLREITAETAQLLFRARFRTLRFGFETVDKERQRATGGKVRDEELLAAIAHLREAGYRQEEIGVYLLCGLPGQTDREVEQSIRFVRWAGGRPILAEYSPIPGTSLWESALTTSRYPIDQEPLFQNNSLLPCRDDSLSFERVQALKALCRLPLSEA